MLFQKSRFKTFFFAIILLSLKKKKSLACHVGQEASRVFQLETACTVLCYELCHESMIVVKVKGLRVKLCTLLHVSHVQGFFQIAGSKMTHGLELIHTHGIQSSIIRGITFLLSVVSLIQ